MTVERSTTTDHVKAVVAIDDRVLRNYWVTQSYADLSNALSQVLGRNTVNWCTFAVWASRTVGRNLRGEQLPEWLQRTVVMSNGMMGLARETTAMVRGVHPEMGDNRILSEHVADALRAHFGVCAMSLSEGNTEVFAEIGHVAAIFIRAYGAGQVSPASRQKVLRACNGAPEFEGVNHLHAGFRAWCDAVAEPDARKKSQLVLTGSLHLGVHEQNHLQPAIAGSMIMGFDRSLELLRDRLARLLHCPEEVTKAVDDALHPLADATACKWGDLMTDLLGTIETPDGVLRLNHDVPALPRQPFIPDDLRPVSVASLQPLLDRFDRADDTGRGSCAEDWVQLDDRMNFITNLFLSRHHRASLFASPLRKEELAALEAGRVPSGPQGPPAPAADRGSGSPAIRRSAPVPSSKGVGLFTDAFVDRLRHTADPPADRAVTTFFEATDAARSTLFRRLAATSASSVADEDLPGIGEFARHEELWPSWADADLVREGQQVFGDFGPQLGMGLFMASLPADYAFAKGVQALARTARLTQDPKRRYLETGQMILNVMTPNGLDPGEIGERTVRHVRLMHAAVRHVLLHVDEIEREGGPHIDPWDLADGLPISQLQLLGTLFSFGVQGIESLRRMGVRLGDREAEAYIHVWNLVGHQIGICEEVLPLSWDDSRDLWNRRRGAEYGPTAEGQLLTAAAIECMRELFDLNFAPGMPASGIRFYLGDQTADLLGVPRADWTRVLFELMRRTDWLYDRALVRLPGTAPLAATLGRRVWEGFERHGRDGSRPAFEVTDEFRAAWGWAPRKRPGTRERTSAGPA